MQEESISHTEEESWWIEAAKECLYETDRPADVSFPVSGMPRAMIKMGRFSTCTLLPMLAESSYCFAYMKMIFHTENM